MESPFPPGKYGRPIALTTPMFHTSLYPCPLVVFSHTDSELGPQEKLKWRSKKVLQCFYFLLLDPHHQHEKQLRLACWNVAPSQVIPTEAILVQPAPQHS